MGIASASAFTPASPPVKSSSTALNESLFKRVSNLDLWAPVADSNQYGARSKKNLKTGKLTDRSYVPPASPKHNMNRSGRRLMPRGTHGTKRTSRRLESFRIIRRFTKSEVQARMGAG